MQVSNEVYEALKTKHGDNAKSLTLALELACRVQNNLRQIRGQITKEVDAWERRREELNAQLSKAQSECMHEVTTYYGDPAGGSDSWYECLICGLHSRTNLEP